MTPIERHLAEGGKPVLQFSGGKDSTACLHLLRPYWDRLTVAWTNAGDSFDETMAIMEDVKSKVATFVEIKTDAPAQIAEHGWPVDLLPVSHTPWGRALDGNTGPRLQAYTVCCFENLWRPMDEKMRELGATLIIRGQRDSEKMKAPIKSGALVNGLEHWFPLEDWSEDQVFAYLRETGIAVPAHYAHTGTSLDCKHCTAWLSETVPTIKWMKDAYPTEHAEVSRRLRAISDAVKKEYDFLESAK